MTRFQCFGLSAVKKIKETAYLHSFTCISVWILHICSFSGRSIPNLKSTRTPEQIEQLSFGAIGVKIPL